MEGPLLPECGAEFDEMNESQPVCPGCGASLGAGRDDADIGALMDEAAVIAAAPAEAENDDPGPDLDPPEPVRIPAELQRP